MKNLNQIRKDVNFQINPYFRLDVAILFSKIYLDMFMSMRMEDDFAVVQEPFVLVPDLHRVEADLPGHSWLVARLVYIPVGLMCLLAELHQLVQVFAQALEEHVNIILQLAKPVVLDNRFLIVLNRHAMSAD